MTVVVVGSLNVDLVVGLERMPDAGETVLGRTLARHPGGKGLNQAVAAARLGAHVHMIGAIGSDDAGSWLRSIVASEGIGDIAIATVVGPSGTALIEVDEAGMFASFAVCTAAPTAAESVGLIKMRSTFF